ncbi:uncharacterized protein BO87DRAFT_429301 [Aspergillus neoniger CBS 115656]|uniref:Uncharacterized protein n=1 Tax=Aspergillus neoniger (strain CBS 115656) TaxID=1448310 RepID=A0A318Y9A1_ASPNB|nr:hypothetical protein BO87DRAFT_429301 [Aspergillus neoniger CBS 115656]PYH30866.1 hypothetical protein BO87DRAFT_429301 [Aspergillus neoniger CBS 115656]
MQHTEGLESHELGRTISRSRSTSMSSDSQLSRSHFLAPPPVIPAPSYIASSAAAQIITADQEFNAADFVADDEGHESSASALVTREALSSLNAFLDNILFNILAAAKSTQLVKIRPAVAEVLKPRLAKEMVSAADDELSEYLGGPEDEQLEFRSGQTSIGEFDLVRSWKLTRLRCMVYTRLGDMEEDDEEEYINQEIIGEDGGGLRRLASHVGHITPAASIFLTSIIEHMGEQALIIAGEIARSRLSANLEDGDDMTETGANRASMDRLVVEDHDMERLALNPTLGRLWRTWRKRMRANNLSRAVSRESLVNRQSLVFGPSSRKSSAITIDEISPRTASSRSVNEPLPESQDEVDPASVPLPMSEHDVQEIETTGFLPELDTSDIQTMQAVVAHKVRPHSLMVLTLPSPRSPSSSGNSPITPRLVNIKSPRHARSRSLPNAAPTDEQPSEVEQPAERTSPTPSEERRRLETMYEHDEDDERHGGAATKSETAEQNESVVPSAAQGAAATPSTSVASVVATSDASSTPVSSPSLTDREIQETDEVENHETDEKAQVASGVEIAPGPVAPQTQGVVDSTPAQPVAADQDASKAADCDQSTPDDLTPPTVPSSADDIAVEKASRPVSTSGESAISESSRSLPGKRGSFVPGVQHQYGRSSPGTASVSSGVERAAVQRLPARPSTSVASSVYSKSRRSGSFSSSREKRPVTAGSTTSQVSSKLKGLIGRPADTGSLRLRTSSEVSRVSTRESAYDDTSGLDELIRSEETIHFTLTPKSMREMELPDSPRWRAQQAGTDPTDLPKSVEPNPDDMSRSRHSTASSKSTVDLPPVPKYIQSKPKSIEIPAMVQQQKPAAGQARDAKHSMESTRDFANFLKSTGPNTPTTPATVDGSPAKSSRLRRLSDATEISKKLSRPASSTVSVAASARSGPRMEARSAVVPRGDQSSDLIDFIREGPPTAGAHRIPRTVAPFRDTMDSDELQAIEPGRTKGAPSVASTQSVAETSLVSVGSRTGLLESTSRTSTPTVMAQETKTTFAAPVSVSDDHRPPRTRRRVPDPYAIDLDDDDELDELLEEPKPKRDEESLIDFLRNVPPPEPTPPQQPLAANANSRRGSASVKARLRRNTASEKTLMAKPSKTSLRQQPDNYMGGASNYTVKVGMERNAGAMNGAYDLKTPSVRQTETSALADFLKNTGPPEPPVSKAPAATKSKDSGFSRLFVRRKKVEA